MGEGSLEKANSYPSRLSGKQFLIKFPAWKVVISLAFGNIHPGRLGEIQLIPLRFGVFEA